MRRFYLLAAMLVATMGLQAQREKPVPVGTTELQTSADTDGQQYYLYSKAGDFFYTSGNNWGTQATQGATGHQLYFRPYTASADTEWDGKTLVIRNWANDTKGWDDVFITGNYLVNDCSNRGNNTWAAEWQGDEVRFYASKGNTTFDEETYGQKVYIGYVPGDGTTWLQPTGVIADAVPVDWTLVKSADYDAWAAEHKLYALAEQLKADIEAAQELYDGIDMSTVEAIYNDATSTEEALNGAREEVKSIIKAFIGSKGTPDDPMDATALIVNPDYGKTNNNSGWQGTSMTVSDGCAELWNLKSFDGYQDITGLTNGIYRLNVHGLYRVAHPDNREYYSANGENLKPESRVGYLYGRSGDLTSDVQLMDVLDGLSDVKKHDVDYEYAPGKWGPNRRAGFTLYNEEDLYSANTVYVPVTDGTLRIGVEAKSIVPTESWCVFDDWNLAYCGDGTAAYSLWRNDYLEKMNIEDGTLAQASLLTPFNKAAEDADAATSPEEITQCYKTMHELYPQIQSSVLAYAAYVKAMDALKAALNANPMATSEPLDLLQDYLNENVEPGSTYANGTMEYITEHCLLDEAGLLAEQAYADSLYARARKLDVKEGTDITELLQNADMSHKNFEGWNPTAAITANFDSGMGEAKFPVAQAFRTKFELSQKVTDIPDGLYKLELNGLYRPGDSETSVESPVVLYINDFESPVKLITAEPQPVETAQDSVNCFITNAGTWPYDNTTDDGYVPNSVYGCSFAFMGGRYKQTVYGLVTGGEMTIGLRDPREVKDAMGWTVFTNFRLTYMAKNLDAMNEVLASLKNRVDAMNESGQYCYAGAKADAVAIIDKGIAATDVEEKYTILSQANEYMKVLASSVLAYNELAAALDYVNDAYWSAAQDSGMYVPGAPEESPEYYTPEYKAADDFTTNTYDVVLRNIEDGVYTNDEAVALAKQLRLTPIVDVVYVVGDLLNAPTWNVNSGLYPLKRQADGTYQGTFTGVQRNIPGGYGNRDMVFFMYQGTPIDCADEHPRWVAPGCNVKNLRTLPTASQYMAVYGGTWKVTINAERTQATFEPVGETLRPDYCYVAGEFEDDAWKTNKNHPLVHIGGGKYYGEFTLTDKGNADVTLFAGEWPMNNANWTEARVGTSATSDTITAERYGQVIEGCDRFYGEPRWVLEPGRFSIVYDSEHMTVTFTKLEDEIAHEGTAEDPFQVSSLYELVALRSKMQPGRVNYVTLESDIDMTSVTTWTSFNLGDDRKGDKTFMNWVDFDGKNHVLYGFTSTTGNYSSLFGVLCGSVRNLGMQNVDVTCTATGSGVLGGYVGHGNYTIGGEAPVTTVENVWVDGKLHVASGYCGGLFGNIGGPTTIKNCYANLAITVDNDATTTGGIVGRISSDLTMDNVYAAGSVTGTAVTAGVVGGVNTKYEGNTIYRNVCVWNNTEQMFGAGKEGDTMEGILYYDGENFQTLQQAVVAWDPNVWSCTMEEGAYPVLKNVQGTGIGHVDGTVDGLRTSGAIYNLSGQRVVKMQKGIYIQNGRKVLVK